MADAPPEHTLLSETFAEFPLGPFPHDYAPWGEYHYWPIGGHRGAWYEPTLYHGWKHHRWAVLESGGRRYMAQTSFSRDCWPMLTAGDPLWTDLAMRATVRPLSFQGSCGIVARYQDSRNFVSFGFDGTGAAVELRLHTHEGSRILASAPFPYDCDTTYELELRAEGGRFTGAVQALPSIALRPLPAASYQQLTTRRQHSVTSSQDPVTRQQQPRATVSADDATFAAGRIALWAICPARFSQVGAACSAPARTVYLQTRGRAERELDELREANPKPVLWRTISTAGFGCGRHLRFGDLNGDGRPEMLVIQHQKLVDFGNYPMISCITALTLEGEILWRIGEPSPAPDAGLIAADVCCQIHDINGDGIPEVLYTRDYNLIVADGRTGAALAEQPTPEAPDLDRWIIVPDNPTRRITGDALFFCDLRGTGRPADLILKNRYNQIWAYDSNLNMLWTHRHNTGHFFRAFDIDGDGRDELMSGYTLLSPDGEAIWSREELGDHADEIAIGRYGPDGGEIQIVEVCGDAGFAIFSAGGRMLLQDLIGHAQRLSVAKFRPELPGLQFFVTTYWGNAGILLLYDCAGNRLGSWEPACTGNVMSPVNWKGDGQEHALLNGSRRQGGLMDGWGRRVVELPDDGHPDLCAEAIDLMGDQRDELVVWDTERLFIYTQDRPPPTGKTYAPKRLPHHNFSNYRADESLPAWSAPAPAG